MRSVLFVALSAATFLMVAEPSAHADDSRSFAAERAGDLDGTSASTEASGGGWYGWQTMLADGAAAGLLAGAVATESSGGLGSPLSVSGITSFGLGAPIVHAAHGRWGVAFADLGLRVGSVLVGGLAGLGVGYQTAATPPACNNTIGCGQPQIAVAYQDVSHVQSDMMIGAAIGALVASTIDAAVFARDTPRPADDAALSLSFAPSISPLKNGAAGGITGTF